MSGSPATTAGVFAGKRRLKKLTMAKTPSTRWSAGLAFATIASVFAACSTDEEPGGAAGGGGSTADAGPLLEADCDPIGNYCGFPFPSNVYLRDDPSGKNESGKRIQFGA